MALGDQLYWRNGLAWGTLDDNDGSKYWSAGLVLSNLDADAFDQTITGSTGIPSTETFGSGGTVALITQDVTGGSGIISGEAFGAGGVVTGPITGGSGIPSGETFGSGGDLFQQPAGQSGIPSGEAFGVDGTVTGPITGTSGIPPGAMGVDGAVSGPLVGASGIPSEETFGTPGSVSNVLESGVGGIVSEEAFGVGGTLSQGITGVYGIPSEESFGHTGVVAQFGDITTRPSLYATYIHGLLQDQYVRVDTIKIDQQLRFQSSASFETLDEASAFIPEIGQEVLIYFYNEDDASWNRVFAGTIDDVVISIFPGSTPKCLNCQVTCVDYSKILQRRSVNKKFPVTSFGTAISIIQWISDNILAAEGVEFLNTGDSGTAIGDVEYNDTIDSVLANLSQITGWEYSVDYDKILRWAENPSILGTAPLAINETDENIRNISVRRTRGMYRNRQNVRANFSRTTTVLTRTYSFNSHTLTPYIIDAQDGVLVDREWFDRVNRIIDVKLNGVSVTFCPDPLSTGGVLTPSGPLPWFFVQPIGGARELILVFNIADPSIVSQAPTTGDTMEVTFEIDNDLPLPVSVDNAVEIAARKAVEGGTGIYEDNADLSDISDRDVVLAYAQGLIDRFSEMGLEINIELDKFGLAPGQTISVTLPSWGVPTHTYLIEQMNRTEVQKKLLRNTLRISNAVQQRDALSSFQRLLARLRQPANKSLFTFNFTLAETISGLTNPGLQVAVNVTNEYIIGQNITLKEMVLYFKVKPTGADIHIDMLVNGVSIILAGQTVQYKTTDTGNVTFNAFSNAPLTLSKGDRMTIDITQVGSDEPGSDGTLTVTGWV